MNRLECIGLLLVAGIFSTDLRSAPLYFRTSTRASVCFSAGNFPKEIKDFYHSKLPTEEKARWVERISISEAKSLYQSLECVHRLRLSKEEKTLLLSDYERYRETRELLYSFYENHLLSEEKTIRFSATEEKEVRTFLQSKKEFFNRLFDAEALSLSEEPLPLESFTNLYLALLLQHWEFFQTAPEFLKESVGD
ncbi:hypothetical protein EHO61_03480 [Leptospira fluminis]|uniref:Uncharacterized protein n=1 Tax=Leptospira fluminis TaxID=2484979 RepID=A0A4R9GTI3_9LEPT|nr:hypothetical protein [Leptospira fluminis]TGK20930.1 hypothetical protein EHO61_03480 [Leptospira fluminis]